MAMMRALVFGSVIWTIAAQPFISEFQPNPSGVDAPTQNFELFGTPQQAFTGVIISIESDPPSPGVVDVAQAVSGTFDGAGLLVVSVPDLENPSHTVVLLDTFTGTVGATDIDTNDDGVPDDTSSFGTVLDAIGVPDAVGETLYGVALGFTDFTFTGTEPQLVFRSGSNGEWYAINDPDNGQVFDTNANDVTPGAFTPTPSPSGSFGTTNPARLPTLRVTLENSAQLEGNTVGGTTTFVFTVTRTGDTTGSTSADFAVILAQASEIDFDGGTLPQGTVNFGNGDTTVTINVPVVADTDVEADEQFTLTLSNPTNGVITTAAATATIINDDALVSITADTVLPEGSGTAPTDFVFTVTRVGDTSTLVTLGWAVTSTQANATDFVGNVLPSSTIALGAGIASNTITVSVNADSIVEPDELFTVTLSNNPLGVLFGTSTVSGTIQNDDTRVVIAADTTRNEGDFGNTEFAFVVTRNGDSSTAFDVGYTVAGAGANPANAADFGGTLPSGTLTFATTVTTQTITINVNGDINPEPNESFTVSLGTPTNAAVLLGTPQLVTATITNDDAFPVISFGATSPVQAEGNNGVTAMNFVVTRTGQDLNLVSTVTYTVTPTGANPVSVSDFPNSVFPTGTVQFTPAATSQAISINLNGDLLVEQDESFTVTLSNPISSTLGATTTAVGTIQNDDTSVSIATSNAAHNEGNSGVTPFSFALSRSGLNSVASDVSYAVTGGGANPADPTDFEGGVFPQGTISFLANSVPQLLIINVVGDTTFESDETFIVTLTNPTAGTGLGVATATGTITNDDSRLLITASNANRNEGDSGITSFIFTISREGVTTGASSVQYTVSGTGGLNGADFQGGVLPTGTVNFASGERTRVVTIPVVGDVFNEGTETFTVTLSNPTGSSLSSTSATATGTIIQDAGDTTQVNSPPPIQTNNAPPPPPVSPSTSTTTTTNDDDGSNSGLIGGLVGGIGGGLLLLIILCIVLACAIMASRRHPPPLHDHDMDMWDPDVLAPGFRAPSPTPPVVFYDKPVVGPGTVFF